MRRIIWAVVLLVCAGATQANAQKAESVDLELVLLADASGSIDNAEIRFQRRGYAAAITHPDVLWAIAQGYDQKIAVTYVEWGTVGSQDVVVPWTIVDGARSAAAFAEALIAAPRRAFGRNAMGEALAFGQALIESNEVEGYRKVIDLSADSANSWSGLSIAEARASALLGDIVINGLAILCRHCSGRPNRYDLEAAFAQRIIGGPGSFVITATGDQHFADAVRKKMLLEIAGTTRPDLRLAHEYPAELHGSGRSGFALPRHGQIRQYVAGIGHNEYEGGSDGLRTRGPASGGL